MQVLHGLLGIAFFCAVAWALSSHRRRMPWRVMAFGIGLQFLLAWLILGETISGRQAAGLVTALAGILLATTSEDPGDAGPEPAARSGDAP